MLAPSSAVPMTMARVGHRPIAPPTWTKSAISTMGTTIRSASSHMSFDGSFPLFQGRLGLAGLRLRVV